MVSQFDTYFKVAVLPSTTSASPQPIPWIITGSSSGLGHWHSIQERFATRCHRLEKKGFEGLRARLDAEREREGGAGAATGILAGETVRGPTRRRTLGDMVSEQFRGTN
jgi:hypothetical protein